MRKNVDNGNSIWEVNRELLQKEQISHSIKADTRNMIENIEKIRREYADTIEIF